MRFAKPLLCLKLFTLPNEGQAQHTVRWTTDLTTVNLHTKTAYLFLFISNFVYFNWGKYCWSTSSPAKPNQSFTLLMFCWPGFTCGHIHPILCVFYNNITFMAQRIKQVAGLVSVLVAGSSHIWMMQWPIEPVSLSNIEMFIYTLTHTVSGYHIGLWYILSLLFQQKFQFTPCWPTKSCYNSQWNPFQSSATECEFRGNVSDLSDLKNIESLI